MILVVIQAAEADRVSEGLRAGIGLGLRGDEVVVALTGPARLVSRDARIERALRTLAELGRPARMVDSVDALIREARAVEVWSSGRERRRLQVGGVEIEVASPGPAATSTGATSTGAPSTGAPRFSRNGQPVDGADLVAQILGSDGPVVVS